MTTKKYRVHDWVKFQYSEIGEYVDENHTDKPLRNDEVVNLLNELHETIQSLISDSEKYRKLSVQFDNCNKELVSENALLEKENEQLKKDVEYWKQIASQYSNELNVFEHCKKYETECKDIYWSSD